MINFEDVLRDAKKCLRHPGGNSKASSNKISIGSKRETPLFSKHIQKEVLVENWNKKVTALKVHFVTMVGTYSLAADYFKKYVVGTVQPIDV